MNQGSGHPGKSRPSIPGQQRDHGKGDQSPQNSGFSPASASIAELFQRELEQQTAALTQHLLELDRGETRPEVLQELMRAAHSLKGAGRIANRRAAVRISHQMEECFLLAQHGALVLDRADVDVLLKAVDFLAEQKEGLPQEREDLVAMKVAGHLAALDRISARSSGKSKAKPSSHATPAGDPHHPPQAEPAGIAHSAGTQGPLEVAPLPKPQPSDRYLRLATETLNRLLGLASESLVESRWLRPFAESLEQLKLQQAGMAALLDKLRFDPEQNSSPHLEELAKQLSLAQQTLYARLQDLETFDQKAAQVSRRLYLEVLRARMRPLSDLSRRLPRMIRDLARLLGKNVRLELSGESTQVDREVLERIEAPLIHLLRNAVDHGCETPEARRRAGKKPECLVRVDARHNGGMLLIKVSDDGMGINPAQLREQVAAKGLADPKHLRLLGDNQLLDYLFVPGFTVRDKATEISGRGIGLDLVHTAVRNLRGSLRVINRLGRGMEFQLQLPLTISVLKALLVEVNGELFALPLGRISRVASITQAQVEYIQAIPHFLCSGRHIVLAHAWRVFGYDPPREEPQQWQIVMLGEQEPRCALIVDKLIGETELLVHPLDPAMGKLRDITAAAISDDGKPILIVDSQEIARSIERLAALGRLAIGRPRSAPL
jgi:two-component system, chemotaxis family, sensor histidine kinase and response regulator WspE